MLLNFHLALLSLVAFVAKVAPIPTISAVGSKFFTSDGNQFYIKGVAYQLIADDPLVTVDQCRADATLMKTLGVNAIRVYHVDVSADHSGCMKAFADAGIYLFVDMDSFKTYIRLDVTAWNQNKSDSYKAVMDNFQQYDNTAGFFVGNEVLNSLQDSAAAPFLLAAAADLKAYREAKKYRRIPIGYSATDTFILRPMLQDYLVCRPDASERLDFYSLNAYEWCGSQSSYTISGYNQLQALASDYPVPIFLSETGCNAVRPRTFDDQAAVLGPDMSGTWSGAIIYEWIQETNAYGLVQYGQFAGPGVNQGTSVIDGWPRQGTPTPIQPDFNNLKGQWATLTPTGVHSSAYAASAASLAPPVCPSYNASGWAVDPNAALPTLGQSATNPSQYPGSSGTGVVASGSKSRTPTASTASSSTASAAATHHSSAGKTTSLFTAGDGGLVGVIVALMVVGAGMILWL